MKKNFVLSHHKLDLEKRWYIRYQGKNPDGLTVTKKVYGFINVHKTVEARLEAAELLILELKKDTSVTEDIIRKEFLTKLDEIKPQLRKKTYWTYYSKVNNFALWCTKNKIKTIEQINDSVITRFLNELLETKSNCTYNAYKNTLYRLIPLECLNRKNLVKLSVPAKFFSQKQKDTLRRHFKKSHPQLWLFCQMIYFTLIRPGELRLLKLSDINLEEHSITIPAPISKNKKTQTVSIPDELHTVLCKMNIDNLKQDYYLFGSQHVPGEIPRKADTFAKWHQRELKELGFDTSKYKLYSWKHTGAIFLLKMGASEKEIQIQGRWHSLDMLDKYLRQLGWSDFSTAKQLRM